MRQPVSLRTSQGRLGDAGARVLAAVRRCKWWPVVAGGLVLPGGAQAVDASKWLIFTAGPLRLKPQLEVQEQFDDNILYSAKANARADLVSTLSPGLALDLGREENPLSAGLLYTFQDVYYARTGDFNHKDHRLAFNARFEKPRLSITGTDTVDFLTGALSFSSAPGDVNAVNLLGRKVDRMIWNDRYHANYKLTEKTFLGAGLTHNRADYQAGIGTYDYDALRGAADFGYQFSEKIAIFGQTYYSLTSAESNSGAGAAPDLTAVGGYLGVRGQFTPKLSGTLQAGLETRSFAGSSSSQTSPVAELDVVYQMTERRVFSLSYSRASSVSVEAAAYSYVTDVVGLTVNQALGTRDKLSVQLGAYMRLTDYDPLAGATRSDHHYSFKATVKYKFDTWLTGSLGYGYERLDTTSLGIVDYGVNRVTLQLKLGY